jgi:lipid-binding SYLF domain-containing protein
MFRGVLIALMVLMVLMVLIGGGLNQARADSGSIVLTVYKAGWIIGGSGGYGTLTFRGKRYPLSVGGLDYGLIFGGS